MHSMDGCAYAMLFYRDHAGSRHHHVSGMHCIGQTERPSKAVCVRKLVQMAFGVDLNLKVTKNLPGVSELDFGNILGV